MKLTRLTEHVWVYPYEAERDRPNLCYIHGDNWSIAVDAGHSAGHTEDFYRALEGEGLSLPEITVLTHWHWDHTLGMHRVKGHCIANELTNKHLSDFREMIEKKGVDSFLSLDGSIRREYEGGKPVIVTLSDIVFRGEMQLYPGNCPVRIFQAESPHTDDSTLVEVIPDRVLILGDSTSGEFPEWTMDPVPAGKLADTIREINPEICVHGHLPPASSEEIIREMLGWV